MCDFSRTILCEVDVKAANCRSPYCRQVISPANPSRGCSVATLRTASHTASVQNANRSPGATASVDQCLLVVPPGFMPASPTRALLTKCGCALDQAFACDCGQIVAPCLWISLPWQAESLQTNFSHDQLAQPEIAEADGILKTCVHYGFCTATCPTYVLLRDENDSPRGRIDLIKVMLEKGGRPETKTVHHLDRCLSCLSCMTTCAVRVDYMHLIDIARSHIEKHYRRPWRDRLLRALLAHTLPYPRRFLAALRLGKLAQPFAAWMPGRLQPLLGMTNGVTPRPEVLAPRVYAAEGKRTLRVALLAGCAQHALDRNINAATIRVFTLHGCEVVVAAGAGCSGAL